jgi:3-oxoacyl-[acyl-carrier-protein] synthase-1
MNPVIKVSAWQCDGSEQVRVVGVGARTAIGSSALATAAAVRGGISGLSLHPSFVDAGGEPVSFAADPFIDPDASVEQRMLEMLRAAATEALTPAASGARIVPDCCVLALPEPRAGLPVDLEAHLSDAVAADLGLDAQAVRVLPRGHAGGLMALQAAAQWLAQRQYQTALVVGVDSYHDEQTVRSLEIHHRLKTRDIRGGFIPGEAAGACLLARQGVAQRAGRPALARIHSGATALEPSPLRSNEPSLGEGLTAVIAAATQNLNLPQEQITLTYCDLNGERFRNEEFAFALLRTQAAHRDPHDYMSPSDCWGDVGAASGPLFVMLAVAAKLRGYAKGDYPLLWAGSDSGYRSAVALEV